MNENNSSNDSAQQSVGHQNILPQRGGTTVMETKLRLELPAVGKVPLMKIIPDGSELTVGWPLIARCIAENSVNHGLDLLWQVSTQYFRPVCTFEPASDPLVIGAVHINWREFKKRHRNLGSFWDCPWIPPLQWTSGASLTVTCVSATDCAKIISLRLNMIRSTKHTSLSGSITSTLPLTGRITCRLPIYTSEEENTSRLNNWNNLGGGEGQCQSPYVSQRAAGITKWSLVHRGQDFRPFPTNADQWGLESHFCSLTVYRCYTLAWLIKR